MKSTVKAIAHRLKQARSAVLKIEAAWAGTQFLLGLGPLGVLIALVLWARRRRNSNQPAQTDTASSRNAEAEAAPTVPAEADSARVAANGLAR